MATITVSTRQIAAARLQLALDRVDGRKSDPRVEKIAAAGRDERRPGRDRRPAV